MKCIALIALFTLGAATSVVKKDRTITQVVKLLQGMMEKSTAEGDEERVIFAKFKCYCDSSEAAKTASIDALTEQIALLESDIDGLQGDTGGLSSECAELKAGMADNKAAQADAKAIREKENKAFNAEEADLTQAIAQMKSALETLLKVGDQSKAGADNKQFMKGNSLLSLNAEVQSALRAASGFMTPAQRSSSASFLQAPFTGTYTSQSGVVVGIIKSMRDTFTANLADARTTEKNAKESYGEFMKLKEESYDVMDASYKSKQQSLGGNDKQLSAKRSQLAEGKKQKKTDEEFLSELVPLCAEKAAGYANRKVLRANEEAAIAEAISILNSDDAFATFATTDATSSGGLKFIQMRSVRRHVSGDAYAIRMAKNLLLTAAKETKSARLSKVVAKLNAENAFDDVLEEIAKMIDLIAEEGKADKKNLDFCNSERKENNAQLGQRKKEILGLDGEIDKLTKLIGDPKTGLKAQIAGQETQLEENNAAQKTETADRLEENLAYQKDVRNLVSAESILTKAIKALSAYYDDLAAKLAAGEALLQKVPASVNAGDKANWKKDESYAGQSDKGGDVINMLEFILKETTTEEMTAHKDEEKGQADYEDSMTKLKKEQADGEKNLADLQDTLAQKEKDLLDAQEDHKTTTADKEAIEAYLLKIKPGCDFITTNFKLRTANRATEKGALEKAVTLIKETPAYKTAVNAATVESYGDCKEPCVKDINHVNCKACQADVTLPAYCAGHKGTKGC